MCPVARCATLVLYGNLHVIEGLLLSLSSRTSFNSFILPATGTGLSAVVPAWSYRVEGVLETVFCFPLTFKWRLLVFLHLVVKCNETNKLSFINSC